MIPKGNFVTFNADGTFSVLQVLTLGNEDSWLKLIWNVKLIWPRLNTDPTVNWKL